MTGKKSDRHHLARRDLLWFAFALALPVPWAISEAWGGMGIAPEWVAAMAGISILGSAFMLSWACELAEREIPQALALLLLALMGVLPEYAVDLHFAWTAGKDPSYAAYAVANMTGANRLLIGFGWALVVLLGCKREKIDAIDVNPSQQLEIRYLIWATLYSFLIPLSGTINLFDSLVLLTLFLCWVREAMGGEEVETELDGPALLIDEEFTNTGRRAWAVLLFAFAGFAIFVSAEPFAESLVSVGRSRAIDEFLLVQWVAPLASEAPEFIIALIFAWKLRASVGLGALISSKVNQWTLLVGALPIAYGLSIGGFVGLPLDARQTQELLLTSAQSLFAVILVADFRFGRREALLLAVLFGVQLSFPGAAVRWAFTGLYLALSVYVLAWGSPVTRRRFFLLLRGKEIGGFEGGGSADSSKPALG
ncbi:MAG: sodium:calcium antiporter [Myxococcota bacterium]|nr:sodium:calcium antiporter [Myxococcota bacterium]